MSETLREMTETAAMQRRLRKSMAEMESLDPDSRFLRRYRALNARALEELEDLRQGFELALRRPRLTPAQRRDALEAL